MSRTGSRPAAMRPRCSTCAAPHRSSTQAPQRTRRPLGRPSAGMRTTPGPSSPSWRVRSRMRSTRSSRPSFERGGLFQRANQIVFLGEAPVITADKREVSAMRIFERGEHALAEDIAEAACLMKWDGRAEDFVVTNPPSWLVRTLQQRTGAFRFPILTAVINAPTLRPDGSLLATPGYDKATGLFYDPRGVDFPPIPSRPTKADADRALAELGDLISGFPFDGPADYAVALSAIVTACVRQAIRSAPMHAFSAPVAGSGKTKLVDIAVRGRDGPRGGRGGPGARRNRDGEAALGPVPDGRRDGGDRQLRLSRSTATSCVPASLRRRSAFARSGPRHRSRCRRMPSSPQPATTS